jgi:hypothetical protein
MGVVPPKPITQQAKSFLRRFFSKKRLLLRSRHRAPQRIQRSIPTRGAPTAKR